MQPLNFEGANILFGTNIFFCASQPKYQPLPAERVGRPEIGQINTCWELSPDELKQIQETGKIWVSLLTFGQPLQPILISVDKPDVYNPE